MLSPFRRFVKYRGIPLRLYVSSASANCLGVLALASTVPQLILLCDDAIISRRSSFASIPRLPFLDSARNLYHWTDRRKHNLDDSTYFYECIVPRLVALNLALEQQISFGFDGNDDA